MTTLSNLILVPAALTTALIAGLFYAYSCSVNPGLSKLGDAEYIAAMQSINVAIINPVFFFSFLGTLLLLPLSAYLNYHGVSSTRFWLLAGAALVYLTGGFGVTIFGNVPLNDALAGFDLQSSAIETIKEQRMQFEGPWNRLHQIRTIACVVSLLLVIFACLNKGE